MEFARRLRTVWCVICALGVAAALFAYNYNPHPSILLIGVGAAIAGCAFYVGDSWRTKLSVLWLGGVGLLLLGLALGEPNGGRKAEIVLLSIPAIWVVAAVLVWVLSALIPKKRKPVETA